MKLATDKFGENNFPDGRGVNFIIEDNVMNQRGEIVLANGHAVQVWSVETGKAISPLLTIGGSARSQAISADGSHLAHCRTSQMACVGR